MPTIQPRLRSRRPGTVDPDERTLRGTFKHQAIPDAEYRSIFPVGGMFGPADTALRNQTNGTATTNYRPDFAVGWTGSGLLNHPEGGLRQNFIPYMFCLNGDSAVIDPQGVPALLDADTRGGMVKAVWGLNADATLVDWYSRVSNLTQADAQTLMAPVVAKFNAHPSTLAYCVRDDARPANKGAEAVTLCKAMQALDTHGRPAIFVAVNPEQGNLWADMGADLRVACTYRYPCGMNGAGVALPEGDLHRATFSTVPNLGGGGGDFVDALREWFAYVPAGIPIWLALQGHGNASPVGAADLRIPTTRELRLQFWIAVGEAVKGIFWFPWDNQIPATINGIGDESRKSYRGVAAELSARLTPEIRDRLLTCDRIDDEFVATGGGSSGYAVNYLNAYVSTLQCRITGTKYVVVCNHSTSAATVTISDGVVHADGFAGTIAGTLRNLENQSVIPVGGSVSLPALDGTIFVVEPARGVPRITFNFGESAQSFWDRHWANPDSPWYVAPSAIMTHSREVVVAPGNLQAAIDGSPDYTTFRLQPGVHGGHGPGNEIVVTGRNGMHFVSDNPANRATMRSVRLLGTSYSNVLRGPTGFPEQLKTLKTEAAVNSLYYPPRDVIFKDIDFIAAPGSIAYNRWESNGDGSFSKGDMEGLPLVIWTYQDILVQNCHFEGYEWQDLANGQFDTPTATGVPGEHPGLISGGRGFNNIVTRDCSFVGSPNLSRGFPCAIYWDGIFGGVLYNCTTSLRWWRSHLTILVNDDITGDHNYDGQWPANEIRNSKFVVIAGNQFNKVNNSIDFMTERSLVRDNTWTYEGGGAFTRIVQFATKPSQWYFRGHFYENYDNVATNNTVTGSISSTFAEQDSDQGWSAPVSNQNSPYRSRVGRATVTNNHATGTVTSWLRDLVGTVVASDGPNTQSGNTP